MKDNKYMHSKMVKAPLIAPLKSERFNIGCDNDNYIFISYSHHDKDIVMAHLRHLYASNANYWYDAEIKNEKILVLGVRSFKNELKMTANAAVLFFTCHLILSSVMQCILNVNAI
jgi:hypothetical protein